MSSKIITITLEGMEHNEGHVMLEDFYKFSENLRKLLNLLHSNKIGKKYRIIAASHNSPLSMSIESNIENVTKPLEFLKNSVLEECNIDFDYPVLTAYNSLIKGYGKKFNKIIIGSSDIEMPFKSNDVESSAKVIETNYFTHGSVTGRLEKLNIHKNNSNFTIYPLLTPSISCKVPSELKIEVSQYVGRRLVMHGKIAYSEFSDFPISIEATSVDLLPLDEDLPKASDIRGIYSNLTQDKSTQEYIDEQRQEDC